MKRAININSIEEYVELEADKYFIHIIGGWGVRKGDFQVEFKNNETGERMVGKKAFWQIQSYAFGKRAKRIFIVNVTKPTNYEVVFKNQSTLEVRSFYYPILWRILKPLPNEGLQILLTRKSGLFNPFLTK